MDIVFFSVNLVGCLIYFLYSFKSHHKRKHEYEFADEDNIIRNIDRRLSKLEERAENQKS